MLKQYPLPVALSVCLAAGALGAVGESAALWASGRIGLSGLLHVSLAPSFAWWYLKPKLLWGALWGAGFTPFALGGKRPLFRALLYSLLPAAFDLLYVYPQTARAGWFGFGLGALTPVLVTAAWAVFGLCLWAWAALCAHR